MSDSLSALVREGIVDEVISQLKSGKEADIYLVQHAGEVVAAKIYKERQARSFHNNAAYKEGRFSGNSRTQRAMDKGTRFGRAAAEEAWKEKEAEVLNTLHAAGVRVPKPVLFVEGTLLMEVVIDAQGYPAPRLIDTALPRELAAAHYADVRSQMVKMLAADLIHGDLSPYNVLLAWDGPTIIDFPQVVGAAHNQQAARFFLRDFETIWRFFAGIDPALNARRGDGEEIWRAYVRRELTADFQPTGRGGPGRFDASRQGPRQAGQSRPHEQRAGSAPHPVQPSGHDPNRQGGQQRVEQRGATGPNPNRRESPRRSAPQPIVSYVGQPPAPPPVPPQLPAATAPQGQHRHRRHRRHGHARP